jgi:Zn-dependent alcohol dehydrogenase
MDVRAAVAFEAGKPLEVTTVQLEGPRASAIPTNSLAPAPIPKGCSL